MAGMNKSSSNKKIIRMPTKTEMLIDKSNYHRIKKFEKLKKMKQEFEPSSRKFQESTEGEQTPFQGANKEPDFNLLPILR